MDENTSLTQLKRTSFDELAYSQLKRAIITGRFKPGQFLAEVQLAQEMGISKTPVRKALGRLQQERFLVNIPYEGYYVAEISVADIAQIYELRVVLECFLLQQTIDRFTDAELDDLHAILEQADAALKRGDRIGFVNLNRDFHHCFDRKHGNMRISDVLFNLDEHVQRILHYLLTDNQQNLIESHQEHYLMLAAMRERDSVAAVHTLEAHLRRFRDALIEQRGHDGPKASTGTAGNRSAVSLSRN